MKEGAGLAVPVYLVLVKSGGEEKGGVKRQPIRGLLHYLVIRERFPSFFLIFEFNTVETRGKI